MPRSRLLAEVLWGDNPRVQISRQRESRLEHAGTVREEEHAWERDLKERDLKLRALKQLSETGIHLKAIEDSERVTQQAAALNRKLSEIRPDDPLADAKYWQALSEHPEAAEHPRVGVQAGKKHDAILKSQAAAAKAGEALEKFKMEHGITDLPLTSDGRTDYEAAAKIIEDRRIASAKKMAEAFGQPITSGQTTKAGLDVRFAEPKMQTLTPAAVHAASKNIYGVDFGELLKAEHASRVEKDGSLLLGGTGVKEGGKPTYIVPKAQFDEWHGALFPKAAPAPATPVVAPAAVAGAPADPHPVGARGRKGDQWFVKTETGWLPETASE